MIQNRAETILQPSNAVRPYIEGLIFAMVGWQFRTSLRIKMVSTDLLSCFFFFFFFFFFYHSLSFS